MPTDTLQRRARPAHRPSPTSGDRRPPLDWRSPTRDLWVATRGGEYAGMTEHRRGRGFAATSSTGRPLGAFHSLDQAMAALERDR